MAKSSPVFIPPLPMVQCDCGQWHVSWGSGDPVDAAVCKLCREQEEIMQDVRYDDRCAAEYAEHVSR